MSTISKAILFFVILFGSSSCSTVYTEKQTEALAKVVYASKDSFDSARLDLADQYVTEATRLVKPPHNRIKIEAIYESGTSNINQRIVLIPQQYKDDSVVAVKSDEYKKLLMDKSVYDQLKRDNIDLTQSKKDVDQEVIKQTEYHEQMVRDLNLMQTEIAKNKLALIRRDIVIVGLLAMIGTSVYLRMKGVL